MNQDHMAMTFSLDELLLEPLLAPCKFATIQTPVVIQYQQIESISIAARKANIPNKCEQPWD